MSFVSLVFGSQAMIYAIRGRPHLWSIRPSLWLAGSSIACILALAGIALAPLPAVVVAATLAAAGAFAVVLDSVKRPVFARLGIV